MADSIEERSGDRCYIENYKYCHPSSKNSQGVSINTELLEEGDRKGFSHHEDFKVPSPSHLYCDEGQGDYHDISLQEQGLQTWGTSGRKRPNRIFPADVGLHNCDNNIESGVVLKSKLESSLYSKIKDAIDNVGNTIKNSFTNVFTSESHGMFGNEGSISENNSCNYDGEDDFTGSDWNTEPQESLVLNTCPRHGLPEDEIDTKDLVSGWLDKVSEMTWENECVSSNSEEKLSKMSFGNFKALSMNMLQYSQNRKFGDLKVCVGKSVYKVDSCFLKAQSTKFRQILQWGSLDEYYNHFKDDYIPTIRLADMNAKEFEALLVYMYSGGYLLPSVVYRDGKEPTRRFLDLLKIYGIPYGSSEN